MTTDILTLTRVAGEEKARQYLAITPGTGRCPCRRGRRPSSASQWGTTRAQGEASPSALVPTSVRTSEKVSRWSSAARFQYEPTAWGRSGPPAWRRRCAKVGSRSARHPYAQCRAGNVVRILRRSQPGVSGVRRRARRARLRRAVRQPRRAVLDHARIQGVLRPARHVLSRPPVRQGRGRAVGPRPRSSHAG